MKHVTREVTGHPATELEVTMDPKPTGFVYTGIAPDGRRFELIVDAPDDGSAEAHMQRQVIGAWRELAS